MKAGNTCVKVWRMVLDPVSEMLALVDARCVITGGLTAGGDWAYRSRPDAAIKLDVVIRGCCWLVADETPAVRLQAGDAVVLNQVHTTMLCSDPQLEPEDAEQLAASKTGFFAHLGGGEEVEIIGGHVQLDPGSAELFMSALPAVLRVCATSAEAGEMRRVLDQIVEETHDDRPGASLVADLHAQLLLVSVLRIAMRRDDLAPAGWLRLLADAQLRPAVALMHADPARAWRLEELAAAAGLSRSHFAQRFRHACGQPPLAYLANWRIKLAQRALRGSETTVAALAERLGYASESSFSHAFTRITGASPTQYRHATGDQRQPASRAQ